MIEPGGNRGFVTRSVSVVHDWGYSRLVTRTVSSPDGDSFARTYVDSPGAVGVVAIADDGTVVLVSQYRAPVDGFVLEIPAGMRDVDEEPPLVTAQRELVEEVGFRASTWDPLGSVLSTAGVSNGTVQLFLARGLVHQGASPDGPEEENMDVVQVPLSEAVAMCMDDRITDSKSVVGLLRAARLLGA
jgi:ADP-ribose pyrophosphatase